MPGLIYAQTLRQIRLTFTPESENIIPKLDESNGKSVLRYHDWEITMPIVSDDEYHWEGHRIVWIASKNEQIMWNRRDLVGKGVIIDIDWEHFDWDDDEDDDAWKEFDIKDTTPIGFASGETLNHDENEEDSELYTDDDIETIATSVANATLDNE